MVQGTASSVGKSVIATALCRILADRGWRVAPFKAQNMSLHAAAIADGREIARAQAAQAEAARVPPTTDMNPILLKPETDRRSQLVLNGRVRGHAGSDYWRSSNRYWPLVQAALRRLRERYDVVVIEGAGSPAELNLRRTDIANSRIARAADAAVLLVGDIERGGIFAQLLGTLDLLPPADRRRVRALLVNKFRGDPSLFESGARLLQDRSGLPVVGVLPWTTLRIPSEDSLPLGPERADALDLAVIAYPRTSNADEFQPLIDAGVQLRFVRHVRDLGFPHGVILPGSKATTSDLEWLRASGFERALQRLLRARVPIWGICGGYQMLGGELDDPRGTQGPPGRARGLGLLPHRVTFQARKEIRQVQGTLDLPVLGVRVNAASVSGYLMRVGRVDGSASGAGAAIEASARSDGLVGGTSAHGLFADPGLRARVLSGLAQRMRVAPVPTVEPTDPYDELAAWFRSHVVVERLLVTLGLSDTAA